MSKFTAIMHDINLGYRGLVSDPTRKAYSASKPLSWILGKKGRMIRHGKEEGRKGKGKEEREDMEEREILYR